MKAMIKILLLTCIFSLMYAGYVDKIPIKSHYQAQKDQDVITRLVFSPPATKRVTPLHERIVSAACKITRPHPFGGCMGLKKRQFIICSATHMAPDNVTGLV